MGTGMVKQRAKADWQRRLEEPGWRISKALDLSEALKNEHVPWYTEWGLVLQVLIATGFLICSVGLFIRAIFF